MIINKDCLEALKELPDNSIDSIVTDPPYHLVSIVKRFGKENSAPAKFGTDGAFSRASKGFMGKDWDGVNEDGIGIAQKVELWKECLRVLKPGGHLLAFSGTRTYHRMASAIEDAGFEVRDMIEWVYGSGFPKSLNIGKAVDKLHGDEREVVGEYKHPDGKERKWSEHISPKEAGSYEGGWKNNGRMLDKGTSDWEGWGTALKPAVEPVSVCSKPLQVEHIFVILIDDIWKQLNVLGVTNNLQDTQVKLNEVVNSVHENARTSVLESTNNAELVKQVIMSLQTKSEEEKENSVLENVAQNGEKLYQEIKTQLGEEVEANLMDISISAQMGDISENTALLWKNISEEILNQANKLTTRTALKLITDLKTLRLFLLQNTFSNTGLSKKIQPNLEPITVARKPIEGTVAENCLKWGVGGINIDGSRVEMPDRAEYEAKQRTFKGATGKVGEASWKNSSPLNDPETSIENSRLGRFPANLIHDGSEEVLELFPNESHRFFYCAKASKSERNLGCDGLEEKIQNNTETNSRTFNDRCLTCKKKFVGSTNTICHCPSELKITDKTIYKNKNNHPTVKPIKLMEYLINLVSKPGHTVLDPFAGSGTTGIACKKLNRNFIGIEKQADYARIAQARIDSIERKML